MEYRWVAAWRRSRYAWLRLSLVIVGMLYPLAGLGQAPRMVWELAFWGVMLQVLVTTCESRALRRTGLVLTSLAVLASAALAVLEDGAPPELRLGALLLGVGLSGVTALLVALDVFRGERRITIDQVYGAARAYILVGLTFALLFFALDAVAQMGVMDDPFEFRVNPPKDEPAEKSAGYLYVSFVTLTTLGYGDVASAVWATRFLCGAEALTGQLYPVVAERRRCKPAALRATCQRSRSGRRVLAVPDPHRT